jgi:hypothetical protein
MFLGNIEDDIQKELTLRADERWVNCQMKFFESLYSLLYTKRYRLLNFICFLSFFFVLFYSFSFLLYLVFLKPNCVECTSERGM